MRAVVLTTTGVAVALMLVLLAVSLGMTWPSPERPPKQGEALHVEKDEHGHHVHAPEALARVIREPQNTWSNFAFVIVGAWLIHRCRSRASTLVGLALIAVGMGSFLYHASATRPLRQLDVGGMYGLYLAAIIYVLGAVWAGVARWTERSFWSILGGLTVAAAVITASRNVVVGGIKPLGLTPITALAATILITGFAWCAWRERSMKLAQRWLLACVLFATAVIYQLGDRPGGWLCSPDHLIQGHALWHIFAALALGVAITALESIREQVSDEE